MHAVRTSYSNVNFIKQINELFGQISSDPRAAIGTGKKFVKSKFTKNFAEYFLKLGELIYNEIYLRCVDDKSHFRCLEVNSLNSEEELNVIARRLTKETLGNLIGWEVFWCTVVEEACKNPSQRKVDILHLQWDTRAISFMIFSTEFKIHPIFTFSILKVLLKILERNKMNGWKFHSLIKNMFKWIHSTLDDLLNQPLNETTLSYFLEIKDTLEAGIHILKLVLHQTTEKFKISNIISKEIQTIFSSLHQKWMNTTISINRTHSHIQDESSQNESPLSSNHNDENNSYSLSRIVFLSLIDVWCECVLIAPETCPDISLLILYEQDAQLFDKLLFIFHQLLLHNKPLTGAIADWLRRDDIHHITNKRSHKRKRASGFQSGTSEALSSKRLRKGDKDLRDQLQRPPHAPAGNQGITDWTSTDKRSHDWIDALAALRPDLESNRDGYQGNYELSDPSYSPTTNLAQFLTERRIFLPEALSASFDWLSSMLRSCTDKLVERHSEYPRRSTFDAAAIREAVRDDDCVAWEQADASDRLCALLGSEAMAVIGLMTWPDSDEDTNAEGEEETHSRIKKDPGVTDCPIAHLARELFVKLMEVDFFPSLEVDRDMQTNEPSSSNASDKAGSGSGSGVGLGVGSGLQLRKKLSSSTNIKRVHKNEANGGGQIIDDNTKTLHLVSLTRHLSVICIDPSSSSSISLLLVLERLRTHMFQRTETNPDEILSVKFPSDGVNRLQLDEYDGDVGQQSSLFHTYISYLLSNRSKKILLLLYILYTSAVDISVFASDHRREHPDLQVRTRSDSSRSADTSSWAWARPFLKFNKIWKICSLRTRYEIVHICIQRYYYTTCRSCVSKLESTKSKTEHMDVVFLGDVLETGVILMRSMLLLNEENGTNQQRIEHKEALLLDQRFFEDAKLLLGILLNCQLLSKHNNLDWKLLDSSISTCPSVFNLSLEVFSQIQSNGFYNLHSPASCSSALVSVIEILRQINAAPVFDNSRDSELERKIYSLVKSFFEVVNPRSRLLHTVTSNASYTISMIQLMTQIELLLIPSHPLDNPSHSPLASDVEPVVVSIRLFVIDILSNCPQQHLIRNGLSELLAVVIQHIFITEGFENLSRKDRESAQEDSSDSLSAANITPYDFLQKVLEIYENAVDAVFPEEAESKDDEQSVTVQDTVRLNFGIISVVICALNKIVASAGAYDPKVAFWGLRNMLTHWKKEMIYQMVYEELISLNRSSLKYLLYRNPVLGTNFLNKMLLQQDMVQVFSDILDDPIETIFQTLSRFIIPTIFVNEDTQAMRCLRRLGDASRTRVAEIGTITAILSLTEFENHPLGEQGDVLATLLTSPLLKKFNERELIGGKFQNILAKRSFKFGFTLAAQDKPTEGQFERALLPLMWQLGSTSEKQSTIALKGLLILCTLFRAGAWVIPGFDSVSGPPVDTPEPLLDHRTKPSEELGYSLDPHDNLAHMLQLRFFYIMVNLIQYGPSQTQFGTLGMDTTDDNSGPEYSQSQHSQAFRVVRALVTIIKANDLPKFIPKVLFVMDLALNRSSTFIRSAAIDLAEAISEKLSDKHLSLHAVNILVSLMSVVESFKRDGNHHPAALRLALYDMKRLESFTVEKFEPNVTDGSYSEDNYSCPISLLRSIIYAKEVSDRHVSEGFVKTVNIMKTLVRCNESECMVILFMLPRIPELSDLREEFKDELNNLDPKSEEFQLQDSMEVAFKLVVRQDSAQVRRVGMTYLIGIIQLHRKNIIPDDLFPELCVEMELKLSNTIKVLLTVCSSETDSTIKLLCAQALGEIGAVDPARINISVSGVKSLSLSVTGNNAENRSNTSSRPPWEYTRFEFGVKVIVDYLVPALLAANGLADVAAQDRAGYAIQEVLKEVAKECDQQGTPQEMPKELVDILQDKGVLETTQGFWFTRYALHETAQLRKPPLFADDMPFQRWLGLWCRHLIFSSHGYFQKIYLPCRGVVRTRAALSRFLLPYVVVDALCGHSMGSISGTHEGIIEEIVTVLRSSHSTTSNRQVSIKSTPGVRDMSEMPPTRSHVQGGQMCIQTIMSVIDQLRMWCVNATDVKKCFDESSSLQTSNMTSSTSISKSIERQDFMKIESAWTAICRWRNVIPTINRIIADVPVSLLSTAAHRIGAYARAIRYLEQGARERHRQQRRLGDNDTNRTDSLEQNNTTARDAVSTPLRSDISNIKSTLPRCQRNDGSNGELPELTGEEIDHLLTAYASLEDTDAIEGILTVRQNIGMKVSPLSEALQLQHLERWQEALFKYNTISPRTLNPYVHSMNNSNSYGNNYHNYDVVPAESEGHRLGIGNMRNDSQSCEESDSIPPIVESGFEISSSPIIHTGHRMQGQSDDELVDIDLFAALNKGRQRCMLELGYLDALIDQASGTLERIPELTTALLPATVEASYKLQQWSILDSLIDHWDNENALEDGDMLSSSPSASSAVVSVTQRNSDVEENFQISIGRLLRALKNEDNSSFSQGITDIRAQIMASLSAATTESYGRAYPQLIRLHILRELEQVFLSTNEESINSSSCHHLSGHSGGISELLPTTLITTTNLSPSQNKAQIIAKKLQEWNWESRLKLLSPSIKHRSAVLDVRSAVLGICQVHDIISNTNLEKSILFRKSGRMDEATQALENARRFGLDHSAYLLQACKIEVGRGNVQRAIHLFEPHELDVTAIRDLLPRRSSSQSPLSSNAGQSPMEIMNVPPHPALATADLRHKLADQILLASKWMIQSQQVNGKTILDRCRLCLDLHPKWEDAAFEIAKYSDLLLSRCSAEQDLVSVTSGSAGSGTGLNDSVLIYTAICRILWEVTVLRS